jgi:type I restriction enzyme S subunit
MNVPKLRFKEFNDEWQNYKVEEILKISNGINKEKEFFGSGTPIINYMDVNKNELISHNIVKGLVIANSKELETFNVKKGDILFTRTSETSDEIGLSSSVIENIDKCIFSGFILKGTQTKQFIHPYFGGYYFRNPKMRKEIIKHSSITTRALTSGSLLSQMSISIPTIIEQEKIGKTLSLLDKKIELQTKKIEDLKLFKLYLQNKLYNANDTKDVLIKDLGEIVTGTTPSKSENKYWDNGNILWITPTDICENRDINDCSCKLTESGLAKGRFIPKNSILVTCIASIGKNAIIKEDGSCNQQINAIIPSKDYNYNYIYYMIENLSNYMKSIAGTSATAIINKEQFGNINIKIHKREVQDKISKILNAFETKIIQEGFKYKKLQNLKKGLMQNMFV